MPKIFRKLFLVLIGLLFVYPLAVSAETITRRIHLDADTIIKGYTVDLLNQGFRVGIFPNVFKEESSIKLEKLDENELENVPEGKNLISSLYLYNISMDRPYVLDDPIILAMKYESDSVYRKQIHFYNRETSSWQAIPTEIDYENKEARAYIHFPYSKVAVFEDQTYSDGPEKITDSAGVWLNGLSGVLVDDKSGKILFEKNANQKLPLASLTKVMTATVFLENSPGFDSEIMISSYDDAEGAHMNFMPGDVVRTGDLFFTTLVGSKNNAAKALARSTGMSITDFVGKMNDKARELEMNNTSFVGVTGLNSGNQASAIDYAKLSVYAYKKMEMLQASTTKAYGFYTVNSGKYLSCTNTNKLLNSGLYITGGKTGYLPYSWGGVNYNLMVKAKNSEGNEILGVIMGNNSYWDLQAEMEELISWGFGNYKWN